MQSTKLNHDKDEMYNIWRTYILLLYQILQFQTKKDKLWHSLLLGKQKLTNEIAENDIFVEDELEYAPTQKVSL